MPDRQDLVMNEVATYTSSIRQQAKEGCRVREQAKEGCRVREQAGRTSEIGLKDMASLRLSPLLGS